MMRDRKNHYQLTWRQIKAKIERFKSVPEQYAEYLVQKGEIVLDDPAPLKKIKPPTVQEPVEKKTSSKPSRRKRKKAKQISSIWQEESVIQAEPIDDFNTTKPVGSDGENEASSNQTSGEKKLQLFPDDDEVPVTDSADKADSEPSIYDSGDDSDNDELVDDSEDDAEEKPIDDAVNSVSDGKNNKNISRKKAKLNEIKTTLKLRKNESSKPKPKKLKVR